MTVTANPSNAASSNLWTAAAGVLATPAGSSPFPPVPANPDESSAPLPPSFAQERIVVLASTAEPEPSVYNVPIAWWVHGRLTESAIRIALSSLCRDHDAFRSRFLLDGEPLLQIVDRAEMPFQKVYAASAESAAILARREVQRPFRLQDAPLMRALLVDIPGSAAGTPCQLLMLTVHQSVIDGMSQRILAREFAAAYSSALAPGQRPSDKQPTAPGIREFARWQRSLWRDQKHWETSMAEWTQMIHAPFEPMDLPYASTVSTRPETGRAVRVPFVVPQDVTSSLNALSKASGVSSFVTLLSALGMLLQRETGQQELVPFVTAACRFRPELRKMVGLVANVLPFRIDLRGDPTPQQLRERVHSYSMKAFAHQAVPFEHLAMMLQPRPSARGHRALVQVQFLFTNSPLPSLNLPSAKLTPANQIDGGLLKPDLLVETCESGGSIEGFWKVRTDLFPEGMAQQFVTNWLALLSGLAA